MKNVKVLLMTLVVLFCNLALPSNLVINISADPMDALENIKENDSNDSSVVDSNAMPAYNPNQSQVGQTTEVTNYVESKTDKSASEIRKENAISDGVVFMDTFMFVSGMLCCLIPMFIIGFWGLACINPVVFDPLFNIMTLKKLHYTEITFKGIIIRSLPMIIFGIMLNGGGFKTLLGRVWYFVGEMIYN
jgi:hypothetical protein